MFVTRLDHANDGLVTLQESLPAKRVGILVFVYNCLNLKLSSFTSRSL